MKNDSNSTVAYICPGCGGTVISGVDILRLSGDMMKLKCTCGESELVTIRDKGSVRFSVPCFFCGKPHVFSLAGDPSPVLYRGGCPYTGMDIFFFGEKESVAEAARQSADAITAALEENGIDAGEFAKNSCRTPKDVHVRDMLMLAFTELLEDGKVFCGCTESGEDGNYSIRETDEAVVIECGKCKRKRAAFCDGSIDTQNLLDADSLTLI